MVRTLPRFLATVCAVLLLLTVSTRSHAVPGDLERLVNQRASPSRPWSAIVVHHTAARAGSLESIAEGHRRRFPRGLAYHFVIGNGRGMPDGLVESGPRWRAQQPGAHVESTLRDPSTRALWDDIGIGIALIGDFTQHAPTPRQRESLAALIQVLRRQFRIPADRIIGHGDVPGAHTACPGTPVRSILTPPVRTRSRPRPRR